MKLRNLGLLPFILCASIASAQELTPEQVEAKARDYVLDNAGPEGKWHEVDGAESPLTAFLVRGEMSKKLAVLAKHCAGKQEIAGFDASKELLLAIKTGEYVENTLHVARIDRQGKVKYVGGIFFVDMPYDFQDEEEVEQFEREALAPYGITFGQINDGEVDEDAFMEKILDGAHEIELGLPQAEHVIKPRKGAKSAYLFNSPVLKNRQGRLPGGTKVRIVHNEKDSKGRPWVYVKTEEEIRGEIKEGWIPASRVKPARSGAVGALNNH